MSDDVLIIPLEKIFPPEDMQREFIDPEKVRELAESIRSVGQLQAGVVRPCGDRYEIVFGHRRFLALKLLGFDSMRAMVRDLSDIQVFEMRGIENLQRVDLNPIEEGRVYQRWKSKFNMSNDQVAARCGKTVRTVEKHIKLLDVPEEFQAAVARRQIGSETALILMQVDDEDMMRYYFQAAVDNGATATVARMWVDDWKKTRVGSYYSGSGGGGGEGEVSGVVPVFQACFCCHGPVEARDVVYVPLCRSCHVEVKGALKTDKSGGR